MSEVGKLKQAVFSSDWEVVKAACARLSAIGGDDVVLFLIGLLRLDQSGIRNQAALALRDIGDNRAVEPLLLSIRRPENYNYNGTMVYALEALKCGRYLKQIFDVLFFETHEAKISADNILMSKSLSSIERIYFGFKTNGTNVNRIPLYVRTTRSGMRTLRRTCKDS